MFKRRMANKNEETGTTKKTLKTRIISLLMSLAVAAGTFAGMPVQEAQAASTLYWPVPGHTRLSQGLHGGNAIDIADGSIGGAPVVAAMGGKVTHIYLCGTQHYGNYHNCNGFGTGIVIAGNDGRIYQYAHMQANSIPSNVYYGAYVSAGQQVGRVGTTGNSSGNHLHFGIAYGQYWYASGINPANETYINKTIKYNVTYSGMKTTFVNRTNAGLYGKINNPGKYKVTQVGAWIWDSKGKLVVNHRENCGLSYSTITQQLNVNTEAKKKLTAGTTYTYQFWAKADNRVFYSTKAKFTTTKPAVTAKKSTVSLTKGNITWLSSPFTRTMILYWKKDAKATGYQIQYSTNSRFSSYRLVNVSKNSVTAKAIRTPYSKRYCYVRVRSYKKSGSKYTFGSWSNTRYVKMR